MMESKSGILVFVSTIVFSLALSASGMMNYVYTNDGMVVCSQCTPVNTYPTQYNRVYQSQYSNTYPSQYSTTGTGYTRYIMPSTYTSSRVVNQQPSSYTTRVITYNPTMGTYGNNQQYSPQYTYYTSTGGSSATTTTTTNNDNMIGKPISNTGAIVNTGGVNRPSETVYGSTSGLSGTATGYIATNNGGVISSSGVASTGTTSNGSTAGVMVTNGLASPGGVVTTNGAGGVVTTNGANGVVTTNGVGGIVTTTNGVGGVVNTGGSGTNPTGTTTYITDGAGGFYPTVYDTQGCSRNPCGVNAQCQETLGGRPVCSCPAGHSGNPLSYCRRAECLDHTECRGDMACRNGVCVNPCAGTCGQGANCEVRNHVPVCSCPAGFKGDAFTLCRRMDPEEQCHPSPCGANTKCQVVNLVPTCSCLPGFIGQPLSGCRHECESDGECGAQEFCKDFKCTSACSQCGQGAQCARVTNHRAVCECPKGYIGSPYTECRPECYGDRDCPSGRPACFYGICKNPCDGACGVGADCNLRGLTPVCSCPKDMTGDPFISCRPFTKEDLCNPNPCGTNAQCTPGYDNTHKERPVCTCLPGYTGNSLTHCVRGECQSDNECGDNKACINYQCVDPCAGQCGASAVCESRRHLAVCQCPSGFDGDALLICRQARNYAVARYY